MWIANDEYLLYFRCLYLILLSSIAAKIHEYSLADVLIIRLILSFVWNINWHFTTKDLNMADILTFVGPFFWNKFFMTLSFYRESIAKIVGSLNSFGPEIVRKATIYQSRDLHCNKDLLSSLNKAIFFIKLWDIIFSCDALLLTISF